MTDIIGILLIIITIIVFVSIVTISFRSSNILSNLASQYAEGLDIGCQSFDELREELIKIGLPDVTIHNYYILVKKDKTNVKIYLREGRIFVDVPKEGLMLKRTARLIGFLKKSGKLRKAVEANIVMDMLAKEYCPEYMVERENDYIKAMQYSNIYAIFSRLSLLLIAASVIGGVYTMRNDPVNYVKSGTFSDYPEKEIGETFEAYFKNTVWRKGEKTKEKNIVKFKGIFPFKDEDGKVIGVSMSFIKNNSSDIIDFGKMKINDKEIEDEARNVILAKIVDGDKIEFSMEAILTMIQEEELLEKDNLEKEDNKEKKEKKKVKKKEKKSDISEERVISDMDFLLPDSNSRTLEWTELEGMSKYELRLARNEIYARYGRKFTSKDLQKYFGRQSWYSPEIQADKFNENMLSEIEKKNIQTIKEVEERAGEGYYFEETGEPLFSIKEKNDIYENMSSYNTWKLSIRELNDTTNEYDSWTLIKDWKKEILATKKNGSNWSYYYYKEDVTRGDVYFDNTPGIMMAETWIHGLLNPWEGVFNKFFPNYVREENGDVIYTYSLEENPRIEMFTFTKDAEEKYILKTVFISSSSPSHPDFVIDYELSNTPLEVE